MNTFSLKLSKVIEDYQIPRSFQRENAPYRIFQVIQQVVIHSRSHPSLCLNHMQICHKKFNKTVGVVYRLYE